MPKIKYLDGLRGLAAIIVVLQHLRNAFLYSAQKNLFLIINKQNIPDFIKIFIKSTINLFLDGNLAVYIFWLLSSYVISIKFFRNEESIDKILISYFTKRYFRLVFPVFISIIFAYFLLKFEFMYNKKLADTISIPFSAKWLRMNYSFDPNFFNAIFSALYDTFFDYRTKSTYNSVLWTIKNEFLGSLFTFSLFGIIKHNTKRYYLYFIILIVLIKLKMLWLCTFLIGHILCDFDYSSMTELIKKNEIKIHKFNKTLLIFSSIFILFSKKIFQFINIPTEYNNLILSTIVVYISLRNNYFKKILSTKLFFWLGKISFSLYLLHLPILCSLSCYIVFCNNTIVGRLIAVLITFLVSIPLSYLFEKYIDQRGIRFSNKIGNYFKRFS